MTGKYNFMDEPLKSRKRVAVYARVSRATDQLMHSLSAQISYYSSLIQSNPEWEVRREVV